MINFNKFCNKIWCMCDRASYMKMTRGSNLMQQLWFIIINNSTCFGHLYVQWWTPHAAVHNLHSWRWTYRCPKHVELFMIINHNCCIKLAPLVIGNKLYALERHIYIILSNLVLYIFLSNFVQLTKKLLRKTEMLSR